MKVRPYYCLDFQILMSFYLNKISNILLAVEEKSTLLIKKESKIDGRFLIVFLLLFYFGGLLTASFFLPYNLFWKMLGVPSLLPSFIDLREVLGGFDCTRLGYDVLYNDPCSVAAGGDALGHGKLNSPMPYPRAWWWFTFLGLSETQTVILGFTLAILFYSSILLLIGKIGLFEGFVYGLILISPPLMLLIERGNVDSVLFIMVIAGMSLSRQSSILFLRAVSYSILVITAMLKIFPVFGLLLVLRERKLWFWIFSFALIIVTGFYFYFISEEIMAIKHFFSAQHLREKHSYGWKVIGIALQIFFTNPKLGSSLKFTSLFVLWFPICLIYLLLMGKWLFSIGKDWFEKMKTQKGFDLEPQFFDLNPDFTLDGFRIGAAIYIGSFAMGWHYDYKLCFWLLAIPFVFELIKEGHWMARPSLIAIFSMIFSLYCSIATASTGALDEFANWYLLVYFIIALAITLPNWMKTSYNRLVNSVTD